MKVKKKITALLLTLTMVASYMPTLAFAEVGQNNSLTINLEDMQNEIQAAGNEDVVEDNDNLEESSGEIDGMLDPSIPNPTSEYENIPRNGKEAEYDAELVGEADDNTEEGETLFTFCIHGSGHVDLMPSDGGESVSLNSGSCRMTVKDRYFVTATMTSDEEYVILRNDSMPEYDEKYDLSSGEAIREITATGETERVDFYFGQQPKEALMANTGSGTFPKKGDKIKGMVKCTARHDTDATTTAWFKSKITSTSTSGVSLSGTIKVYCTEHSDWMAKVGKKGAFTYTVSSADPSTGVVKGKFFVDYDSYDSDDVQNASKSGVTFNFGPQTGTLKIQKKAVSDCADLLKDCPNMCSLAGAVYGVYASQANALTDSSRLATLTTNATGTTGAATLNAGTYYVKEIAAPAGFAIDTVVHAVSVTAGGSNTFSAEDKLLVDPIYIVMQKEAEDENYLNPNADMSGAVFEYKFYDSMSDDLTQLTNPVKTWRFVTKEKVVEDKKYYTISMKEEYFDETFENDALYKDSEGAVILPRGTLTIQEITAPEGFDRDEKTYIFHVDINSEDESLVVFNEGITPENANKSLVPSIKTTATDFYTKEHSGMNGETIVVDRVDYEDLWLGESYTIKGTLMDQATGEPVLDKEGKPITSEETFTTSEEISEIKNVNEASGTVELKFNLDTEILSEHATVVYEKLYWNNEKSGEAEEIANHEDIEDEGQTVLFPTLHTTATDKDTELHIGLAEETSTIKDVVAYTNLVAGKEYKISGKLMNKATGESVKDVEGKEIVAEKTFTPNASAGEVELEYILDSKLLDGATVVVFEDLYYGDVKVATHSDIDDEDQSVSYPSIGTTAVDSKTEDHLSFAEEESKYVDTVAYDNLLKGVAYTLSGEIMNKATGESTGITASKEFTPDEISGETDLEFDIDTKDLAGESLVAFETISIDNDTESTVVAEHKDLDDEGQTIHIPSLGTEAVGNDTLIHETKAGKETCIIDTVSYHNLVVGKEYEIIGHLFSRTEDKELENISASKTFTAEKPDGTVDIEFTFDGTEYAGDDLVAFESLYFDSNLIGLHEDKEDDAQTVSLPKVKTKATLINKNVKDVVSFENLLPGTYKMKGYLVLQGDGSKIDKTESEFIFKLDENGEIITDLSEKDEPVIQPTDNPGEEVSPIIEEINEEEPPIDGGEEGDAGDTPIVGPQPEPEAKLLNGFDGVIEMTLPIDKDKFAGKKIVAFEELYLVQEVVPEVHEETPDNPDDLESVIEEEPGTGEEVPAPVVEPTEPEIKEVLVADHTDVNDKDQTIAIAPKTGDSKQMFIYLALYGLCAAALCYSFKKRGTNLL